MFLSLKSNVGADWLNYYDKIESFRDVPIETVYKGLEPLFHLFIWISINIFDGHLFFHLITSGIFLFGLRAYCLRMNDKWSALLVAYPYLIVVVGMGYIRQSVAIGIVFLALSRLLENKRYSSTIIFGISSLVHLSSVINLAIVFLNRRRGRNSHIYIISAGLIWFIYTNFIDQRLEYFNNSYVIRGYSSSGTGIRLLIVALCALIFQWRRDDFRMYPAYRVYWGYFIFSNLLLIAYIFTPSTTALDRIALYCYPFIIFVLSSLNELRVIKSDKQIGFIVSVLFAFIVLVTWLLFATHSKYWLPYNISI